MRYKFKPGDRVILSPGTRGMCAGTILERDGTATFDGDWEVASEGHGYAVTRYEREMIPLEDSND